MMTYVANTTLVVMDPFDPVVQPTTFSQPLSQYAFSRFYVAYPWGMPHNYNPRFATGNLFMSYQFFVDASSNVNHAAFPWGMYNPYSAQGVETE